MLWDEYLEKNSLLELGVDGSRPYRSFFYQYT